MLASKHALRLSLRARRVLDFHGTEAVNTARNLSATRSTIRSVPRLTEAPFSCYDTRRSLATEAKPTPKGEQEKETKEGEKTGGDNKKDNKATAAEEGVEEEQTKSSLKDTINRIKGEGGSQSSSSSSDAFVDDLFRRTADYWASFKEEVGTAWKELISSGDRKSINKKITPVATAEGDKPYNGPVDILVIDPSEHLTAWERMQRRLQEAPIIQDVLHRTEEFYEKSGARKIKERVDEVREDAREAWETSQNPWVYRVSSVYDTLTAETPESIAVKELRQLDPNFTLEDWRQDVVEHTLPRLMQWFLEGRINQLKDWFSEGVFKRIAAEITARKQEGVEIDTHVLGIMNSEILAVEVSWIAHKYT